MRKKTKKNQKNQVEFVVSEESNLCVKCNQEPCVCEIAVSQVCSECHQEPCVCEVAVSQVCSECHQELCVCIHKSSIKLSDDSEREILSNVSISFFDVDGEDISAGSFINNIHRVFSDFFDSKETLYEIWSNQQTRKNLIEQLSEIGYKKFALFNLQKAIGAEESDLFDVFQYIAFNIQTISRKDRAQLVHLAMLDNLKIEQREFVDFILHKYIEMGIDELDRLTLPQLVEQKYPLMNEGVKALGGIKEILNLFSNFQKYLYGQSS